MSHLPDIPQNRTMITFDLECTATKTILTFRQQNFGSETAYKHANFFWNVALYILKNLLEQSNVTREGDSSGSVR